MTERVVVDTGPLIALSRAGLLEPVAKLPIDFICPAEVGAEIEAGVEAGYRAALPEWVTTVPLASPIDPVALASLDEGEAAVIQLALESNIERVCIDELKGRRAAMAVGLKTIGSLGLLAKAKVLGIIPALRPEIEKLVREGAFYGENLVRRILAAVDEK
ncbi:MAG: DUF3368 domain-containing protein [Polyangia bacterium]